MRITLLCVALAACTPEVVSGSYLCGPEAACPEGLACDGVEDTCVIESTARPFTCESMAEAEPDDTAEQGVLVDEITCATPRYVKRACMPAGDSADWITFVSPEECAAPEVEAELSFSFAWQVLGLELWDLDANKQLATDEECKQGADTGQVRRCLELELVPGTKYGVKVHPTGEGACGGDCAFNRYTLSVQLATSG